MSFYPNVTARLHDTHVDVGWDHGRHTYFVQAFGSTGRNKESIYSAGYEEPFELRTLYSLVAATWALIDWPQEPELLRHLRDDPVNELRISLRATSEEQLRNESRPDVQRLLSDVIAPTSSQNV